MYLVHSSWEWFIEKCINKREVEKIEIMKDDRIGANTIVEVLKILVETVSHPHF